MNAPSPIRVPVELGPPMETKVLTASSCEVLTDRINEHETSGWRLLGPVVAAVSMDGGFVERLLVATLQREVTP